MGDQVTISLWVLLLLVAKVFLDAGEQGIDILEIERRINRLHNVLAERGAPVFEVHRSTRARVISEALHILLMRRLVTEDQGVFRAVPEETPLIAYYANAIAHWWEVPAGREAPARSRKQRS